MAPSSRLLAVPFLGEQSGGVGQVSALLWDAFAHLWPDHRELVTLLRDGRALPGRWDKARFAGRLIGRQIVTPARWIVFAHLGLARVERLVPARLRLPYAVFLHGIEAWDPLPAADRAILRNATLRIANSAFTARRIMDANPDIGNVEACRLALADDRPDEEAVPPLPEQPPVVLIVGRMSAAERYKGHDELIDAWPDIQRQSPKARLVIVGDGDDRPRLESRARLVDGNGRIQFTGFVPRDELHGWYRRASVFAMPSRGEGFGLVYLEAMAHRVPCIGSTRDAATEVVVDGETGLLVDPADRAALVGAVGRLLTDVDLRQRFGQAGFARLRSEFNGDRFRRRLAGLVDALEHPGAAAASR